MSKLTELAEKSKHDIGDIFYEPVYEVVQGSHQLEIQTWARKHEIKEVFISSITWTRETYKYYGDLGVIDTKYWFKSEVEAKAVAEREGLELVRKQIKDEERRIEQATIRLREIQQALPTKEQKKGE